MQDERASERRSVGEQWTQLNKHQKIAFITLVIGGVFAFVFSAMRVRQGIYAPFLVPVERIETQRDLLKDPVAEQEKLQKRIDTDGDGLSDWAEENLYQTSPYLWSTAGDSVPDNVKLARGENPYCKSGEACDAAALNYQLPTTTLPYNDLPKESVQDQFNSMLLGTTTQAQNFREQAQGAGVDMNYLDSIPRDPQVLRKALLETGKISEEELNKRTDEELLGLLDETIEEMKQKNNLDSAAIPTSSYENQ